jgi:hypothetical protein
LALVRVAAAVVPSNAATRNDRQAHRPGATLVDDALIDSLGLAAGELIGLCDRTS